MERSGIALWTGDVTGVEILDQPSGGLAFELRGFLPDGGTIGRSELTIRERFARDSDDGYLRTGYAYELLDRERGYRRAFHLHDPAWFQDRFLVMVHEHCERPIGHVACPHHEGRPIRDAYAAVELLMGVWVDEAPDCDGLPCLGDERAPGYRTRR